MAKKKKKKAVKKKLIEKALRFQELGQKPGKFKLELTVSFNSEYPLFFLFRN